MKRQAKITAHLTLSIVLSRGFNPHISSHDHLGMTTLNRDKARPFRALSRASIDPANTSVKRNEWNSALNAMRACASSD